MKKPNKLTESIGKTISAVERSFGCFQFLISFTDGTFSVLDVNIELADVEWDGVASIVESDSFLASAFTDENLVRAGVATHEELRAIRAEIQRRDEEREEAMDIQEYKRLKRKFEGPTFFCGVCGNPGLPSIYNSKDGKSQCTSCANTIRLSAYD
jgi:hypothetical protein